MDDEEGTLRWTCHACGNVGFANGEDGFYYCLRCNSQAEDIIETGVADEDFVDKGLPGGDGGALYSAAHTRRRAIKAEPISQYASQTQSQLWSRLDLFDDTPAEAEKQNRGFEFADGIGPTEPADFCPEPAAAMGLSYEDYYSEVRMRYVLGLQMMIQSQCEALVKKFKVNRMICGLTGTIWLRFVARTGVFNDDWADDVFQESESQRQGEREDFKPRSKFRAEPHNLHGQRAVVIWYRCLRKKIPLSCSLAISFLACHIIREAILPTDILKWSLEGKLPYFAAFLDIEKQIGPPSSACPLSPSVMFRPSQIIAAQKLETLAASIADSIGLHLPPVNFHGIASRYLQQLSLPIEKILPQACKIYEWSMPPDLWLSVNELRLPTRVGVMSILIVAIRILYNIHGYGAWEKSFQSCSGFSKSDQDHGLDHSFNSKATDDGEDAERGSDFPSPSMDHSEGNTSHLQKPDLDASKLLRNLDEIYKEIDETYDFFLDLPTYLQYCNDVVFAGLEPSFEDHEEERITRQLNDFYQKVKDSEPVEAPEVQTSTFLNQKRPREEAGRISEANKRARDEECATDNETSNSHNSLQQTPEGDHAASQSSSGDHSCESDSQSATKTEKDEAIRRLKIDMEDKRFYYVPPRVNLKRFDYLHYARKKDDGALTYIAHADYYILLRACARAAQVDIRIMHVGVLSFERRLAWLEKRIDHCLHLTPPDETCDNCSYVPCPADDADPIGLSNLSL